MSCGILDRAHLQNLGLFLIGWRLGRVAVHRLKSLAHKNCSALGKFSSFRRSWSSLSTLSRSTWWHHWFLRHMFTLSYTAPPNTNMGAFAPFLPRCCAKWCHAWRREPSRGEAPPSYALEQRRLPPPPLLARSLGLPIFFKRGSWLLDVLCSDPAFVCLPIINEILAKSWGNVLRPDHEFDPRLGMVNPAVILAPMYHVSAASCSNLVYQRKLSTLLPLTPNQEQSFLYKSMND